jgi:hypothetical protein
MEVTSWPDSPRIDVRAEFEYANQKIGTLSENKRDARSPFIHEAKLRFKFFPQAGERVTGVRDLPFVVAETDAPYVQGNYWTAVAGSRGGTAVFNRGVMCSVREADGGVSIPLAYSMYYIWGTRILSGKYTYEFALYPFSGPWAAAGLHRRALEYNYPFRVLGSRPGSGAAGNRVALFEVESEHVIASALFPKGGKACLRMYEHAGRPGEARLRYAAGRGRLIETDLAGKAGRPAGPAVAFRPWQIRTFQFEV